MPLSWAPLSLPTIHRFGLLVSQFLVYFFPVTLKFFHILGQGQGVIPLLYSDIVSSTLSVVLAKLSPKFS